MSVLEDLRSMSSFYPGRPALLYDELNDQLFEWTPKRIEKDYNVGGAISDITESTSPRPAFSLRRLSGSLSRAPNLRSAGESAEQDQDGNPDPPGAAATATAAAASTDTLSEDGRVLPEYEE